MIQLTLCNLIPVPRRRIDRQQTKKRENVTDNGEGGKQKIKQKTESPPSLFNRKTRKTEENAKKHANECNAMQND